MLLFLVQWFILTGVTNTNLVISKKQQVGHDFSDSVNKWSLYTVIFLLVFFDIFGEVFLCDKCNLCLSLENIMCGPTTCLRTTNNEYQAIEFRISTEEPSIHCFISYFWNWIFYSCISFVIIILENIIDEQYYHHLTLYFFTLLLIWY